MKKYDAAVSETKPELPKEKQTVLGLYVTAKKSAMVITCLFWLKE